MFDAVPSLRHLQVLEAVARLRSITRASKVIHLTQPAVTQAIAKLEATAGAKLFERRITGTHLTKAGELYLERTGVMFRSIEEALCQIRPSSDRAEVSRTVGKITRAQMRALIAISQSQSQAQAAALIGISQASLHRAARDLESNVGAKLYHRAASGVMATEAGQLLACRLQLAINEFDEICEEIRAGHDAMQRCIRLGALILDPAALLGSVLVEFTQNHPETIVKMSHAPFDILRQKLRSGTLDFTVGVLKTSAPDLVDEPLFVDPYVIAARRDHPLTRRASITADDLLKYDWIVANQGAPRHAAFRRLFTVSDRMPSTTIETHSLATIRIVVAQSDRLTLLTRSELKSEEMWGVFAPLGYPSLESAPVIGVTMRHDWTPNADKQAFLDLLHQHSRTLQMEETARANLAEATMALERRSSGTRGATLPRRQGNEQQRRRAGAH